MPAIMVMQHGVADPARIVAPGPPYPFWMVLVWCLIFLVAALGEELGWQGYAVDLLLDRWSALAASVVLGMVWAGWHIVPLIQLGASPTRIVGQCIDMVATRILIVWLYRNTGKSLFAAVLYHAMYNVSTLLLPSYGLHYDPVMVCIFAAGAAALVTFLWGPETLAHYRYARADKQAYPMAEEIK
jgi:membrane protease YdiL (CAAX protease family)